MKKSNFAIIILLIIALGVFLISNYVTTWTNEAISIKEDIKRKMITSHRNKMRQILCSAREGLMYDIENNNLNVGNDETINELIYKHIAPITSNSFGEVLLFRISPDKKVLFDSSNQTIKEGLKTRGLKDEIISQKKAEKIVDEKLENNNYFKDGVLSIGELREIKLTNPEVYNILDKYIYYSNLETLSTILMQLEKGNPTTAEDNYTWSLKNGTIEMLEWIIIPPGSLGFDDEPNNYFGIENENHKWVLMLRSDKNKVLSYYEKIEKRYLQKIAIAKIMYLSFIFVLVSSILIISYYVAIINNKN